MSGNVQAIPTLDQLLPHTDLTQYPPTLLVHGRPATKIERKIILDAGPEKVRAGYAAAQAEVDRLTSEVDDLREVQRLAQSFWPEGGTLSDALEAMPENVREQVLDVLRRLSEVDPSPPGPPAEVFLVYGLTEEGGFVEEVFEWRHEAEEVLAEYRAAGERVHLYRTATTWEEIG